MWLIERKMAFASSSGLGVEEGFLAGVEKGSRAGGEAGGPDEKAGVGEKEVKVTGETTTERDADW